MPRMQHGGDEPAPGRNRRSRSRRAHTRGNFSSIRPAGICRAGSSCRSNITWIPLLSEMSEGAQSAGKRLAVPARQLALKPNLQILRRRRRPLLRGLEQPRQVNPGGSCPSAFAIGPMGPDQRVLVLVLKNSTKSSAYLAIFISRPSACLSNSANARLAKRGDSGIPCLIPRPVVIPLRWILSLFCLVDFTSQSITLKISGCRLFPLSAWATLAFRIGRDILSKNDLISVFRHQLYFSRNSKALSIALLGPNPLMKPKDELFSMGKTDLDVRYSPMAR